MKRLIEIIIRFFQFLPEPKLSKTEQEAVQLQEWCELYGEGYEKIYTDKYIQGMAEKRLRPPISRRL